MHAGGLQHAGERKHVAHIVFHDQHGAAFQRAIAVACHLKHAAVVGRQGGLHLVQKQRDLVQQPLGRARVLDDDRLGKAPQPLLFVARERAAGVDDDWWKSDFLVLGHLLQQLVAAHVGQAQVHHHAVEGGAAQQLQRMPGGFGANDLHLAAAQQRAHAFALVLVVLHHQHAPQYLRELGLQALQRLHQFLALDRLERIANGAALQRLLCIVGHRQHVHRNVPCRRVALELVQHTQTRKVRQVHVQHDGAGQVLEGRIQPVRAIERHQTLETHFARQLVQDAGKTRIVLDHQDGVGPVLDGRAVAVVHGAGRGCFKKGCCLRRRG